MTQLEQNYHAIVQTVADTCKQCGRNDDIKIIAVTKTRSPEQINACATLGIKSIGENRVQELLEKYDAVDSRFDIQIIGQLQTNKVKYIADKVSCVQSLDRLSLAQEINKRCSAIGSSMSVLAEINLTDDPDRGGTAPEFAAVESLYDGISKLSAVTLRGLMTVAPLGADEKTVRGCFARVRSLFERLKEICPTADRLSMGMSSDYKWAILEGATEIRIGSALFGKRNI